MTFELAGNFISLAARKYGLSTQVSASIICERAKKILLEHFPNTVKDWDPTKFENGKLTIGVTNSSASAELFMQTHEILDIFEESNLPNNTKINEILISRQQKKLIY